MRRTRHPRPFRPFIPTALLLAVGVLLWTSGRPAWSDDRDLLRETSSQPYVFILFDTSGSMNDRPGDTSPIAAADDPESKFYQAKQALYQVIDEFDDIYFGFSTFNQDRLRVRRKHWIYKASAAPAWDPSKAVVSYPVNGVSYAFGGGQANTQASCNAPINLPASAANRDALTGYPRTGDLGTSTHTVWLQEGGRRFRIDTELASGSKLGDASIIVELRLRRISRSGSGTHQCSATFDASTDQTITIRYDLVTDAILSDQVDDTETSDTTCDGLDPNNDGNVDPYIITSTNPDIPVRLKYTTAVDPDFPANRKFDSGDLLPLSWGQTNKDEVLRRLAPNLRLGETVPDFRIARYFGRRNINGTINHQPTGNTTSTFAMELLDPGVIPLVADGLTPLGNSMEDFRTWYAGCATGTCTAANGWKDVAASLDPSWSCRKKFLIVLTDGDETCDNADGACEAALDLKEQDGIITFVIGFGLANDPSDTLLCMAENGGSGEPVYPQDQSALLEALRDIFEAIREQSRAFASAAVPGVQAEVQDKIYLTNFTPLDKEPVWDGHIDAYLKPLPLTAAGLPDRTKNCTGSSTSGCRVWDAGEQLLEQAPTAAELAQATPDYRLGAGANQRRVFYSKAQVGNTVPVTRRLLEPPTVLADKQDLWAGLGIPAPNLADSAAVAAADQKVTDIIKFTLGQKQATVDDPLTGATRDITYVLGDIFHSNPTLLSTPNRFRYFSANLNTRNETCEDGDPGYRCFVEKHRLRRKMLIVGSNDAQLHVFDAGIFRGDPDTGSFDNGTGNEILSYVPRPLLPNLTKLAAPTAQDQEWGVDGTVQVDDVFIDPAHNGTPTASQREWRSVVVGGFREGGNGYFALDLTQPDTLDDDNVSEPVNNWVPSCWNGGSGCGPVPFGAVLWTFTDTADEDNNSHQDLGETWSTPNTGRIKVVDPDDPTQTIDKYVAIFGGGLDPANLNQSGNWLYMVDIETGKILYKEVLDGSAPSDPAAVDTDQDGYLDTVYIGTTAGTLYKARIGNAVPLDSVTSRVTDASWKPFPIFDTLQSDTNRRAPIYFPPSVIFVSKLGRYALGFGTGNREDLWDKTDLPGRFYLILDESFTRQNFLDGNLPRRESQYFQLDTTSAANPNADFLLRPNAGKAPGWFLRLAADERMITKAFALSGIVVFTSFDPETTPQPAGGGEATVCARAGESHIFIVYTNNGDPLDANNTTDATLRSRYKRVPEFVTNPFVESSGTKNPPCDPATNPNCPPPTPPVCKNQGEVTKTLMQLFPTNCKFANYTQNIQTIQSDEGLVCIAPVPLCIVEKNWREF